jgi:hypothetical protein
VSLYVRNEGLFSGLEDGNLPLMSREIKPLTGGSSSYYELPEDAKELQDLIEFKNMNFAIANIFKAAYRLGEKPGTDRLYDLDKMIWFATREKARIANEKV